MSAGQHLDDDRLSALVDGEAPPDDVAHAETCAECGALLAAWREASRLVSVPPDRPPAVQRDAAVQAALTAAGARSSASNDDPSAGPVSLDARRARRRASWALIGTRVAAVAAAVTVIGGLALAVSHGGGSSSKSASLPGSTVAGSSAGGSAASGSTASGSATTLAVPSTGPDFGGSAGSKAAPTVQFAVLAGNQEAASLVPALRAALGRTPPPTDSSTVQTPSAQASFAPCLSQAVVDARVTRGSKPALEASLTYQGAPAHGYVFPVGTGHVVAVVRVPGCALLTRLAF